MHKIAIYSSHVIVMANPQSAQSAHIVQNPQMSQSNKLNQNVANNDSLAFMTQSFKTMQEYQSSQFEYMLKCHTQIMEKLIDM